MNIDLKSRTKQFVLRVLRVFVSLPKRTDAAVLGKQLLRSETSVGAQYREALRARSSAEFVSKLDSAQQEMEESMYWLELVCEHGLLPPRRLEALMREAEEIQAMLVASSRTARKKLN
ncbi:MAG: four helix bundle protein [Opitutales bacterium]